MPRRQINPTVALGVSAMAVVAFVTIALLSSVGAALSDVAFVIGVALVAWLTAQVARRLRDR
jgi:hypothetical protein